ncbi:MAG: aldehyde ferredoxin oxidoreductase family protein [Syntrophobacterales bacterium]|nr:aldehyde ferredoxin oxidoreductase family protein [Syntrophobacterales bacterium]
MLTNSSNGMILHVDLSSGIADRETLPAEDARKFIGGNGFAAKLIGERVPANVDPLGEKNGVAIAVGPLTDTPLWGTSRAHMAVISPLTGLFCDSNFGGAFAIAQKRTGLTAIFIQGKAARPVYLFINEDKAEIRDASHVWGKTTEETIVMLQGECGKGSVCMAIGPAGERKIPFANVVAGGQRLGTAGRGGQGAVMGSKNLKAVVVKGGLKTAVADGDGLRVFLTEKFPELKKSKGLMTSFGTGALPGLINAKGMIGTRNNTRETFDEWREISADYFLPNCGAGLSACPGCVLACGKNVTVGAGEYEGQTVKMPEYETIYALGSMLDNPDLNSLFNAAHLCDLLGMDTISLGVTLAFVAECSERGIVTEADLGGRVNFSDGKGLAELVKLTARQEGVGKLLAMGSRRLSELFGKDSAKYLYEVKGLEIAGHSARGLRELSLGYAVATRGGSHHDTRPFYPGTHPDPGFATRPEYVVKSNHFTSVGDSLVICRFIEEGILGPTAIGENMARAVNLITGWGIDAAWLERCGESIYNLERLINCRRGVTRKDDTLPWRVMHEPIPAGPSEGRFCPPEALSEMLDRYYQMRGWDKDGVPTPEKLRELGLPTAPPWDS